ncbi:MAG TPA: hypothetical protein VH142_19535 [Polyangiaceae bacterium]|nr:hypothetical protein [Polyangiaceae bacterium]
MHVRSGLFIRARRGIRAGFAALSLALPAPALVACASSGMTSSQMAAQDLASAGERLKGSWVLNQFQPEVSLEPMLAQLLQLQVGHLVVTFDGAHFVANGVGAQATRTYRVVEADGDHLKMTFYDDTGVPYDCDGYFDGNALHFEGLTSPWTGSGVLVRTAPQQ